MQTEEKNQAQNKKTNRKKRITVLAIIILAVIIILLLLRSCGLSNEDNPFIIDENAVAGDVKKRSQEEIQKELNEKVAEGMINISMNIQPVFQTGNGKGTLNIVNDKTNNYPQVVYIVRDDTQEEIYRSGGILVGHRIETAPLSVELPPGQYECTAYFSNVDPQTGNVLGTAGANITIHVLG